MKRDDPARADEIVADISRFMNSARRVAARGRERFFDRDNDDQRRIARSLALDLATATDRLPEVFRDAHPEINWRGIRGLRNVIAHNYWGTDDEVLWEAIAVRFPEIAVHLGIE